MTHEICEYCWYMGFFCGGGVFSFGVLCKCAEHYKLMFISVLILGYNADFYIGGKMMDGFCPFLGIILHHRRTVSVIIAPCQSYSRLADVFEQNKLNQKKWKLLKQHKKDFLIFMEVFIKISR